MAKEIEFEVNNKKWSCRLAPNQKSLILENNDLIVTDRQLEILLLSADGLDNKEIAAELGLATSTVKNHLTHMRERNFDRGSQWEPNLAVVLQLFTDGFFNRYVLLGLRAQQEMLLDDE